MTETQKMETILNTLLEDDEKLATAIENSFAIFMELLQKGSKNLTNEDKSKALFIKGMFESFIATIDGLLTEGE